ncbi:hypothetical protein PUR33_00315, partial [Streptomyces sp. BE282]|uniref:hypothetical protein n=1 Tax=Streptomyces sp. BE282 TaxID=3002527 RepID=UPI002E785CDF
ARPPTPKIHTTKIKIKTPTNPKKPQNQKLIAERPATTPTTKKKNKKHPTKKKTPPQQPKKWF